MEEGGVTAIEGEDGVKTLPKSYISDRAYNFLASIPESVASLLASLLMVEPRTDDPL